MQAVTQIFYRLSNQGRMTLAIALLAGAPLLFYGLVQLWNVKTDMDSSMFTRGRVIKTVQIEGGFFPMVRLETTQGPVRFTDRSGSQQQEFRDGEDIDVVFPQYEPQKGRIYSWKRVWLIPTLTMLGGALPLVLGLLTVVLTERKRNLYKVE
ncbi:MAG: DUF3592 domain-containing protein [Candidatus Kapaibacterium sp.]|nr:MAG: DUF3592 domain-containing protein [Candidatus Kapabacteria bacterium]